MQTFGGELNSSYSGVDGQYLLCPLLAAVGAVVPDALAIIQLIYAPTLWNEIFTRTGSARS
ncbi:hypothetical protein BDV32DRAFT_121977 [Aspergillus pseudonomiae]|nr:hypothetical protein BDV32DRAFT_121977 [Aspergillus pseudonomiae]